MKKHVRPVWLFKKGDKSSNWKGGRTKTSDGYISILCPTHPFCNGSGRVFEHRLIMEQNLGRYLLSNEICHHINGIKYDNKIGNLELMTKSEHRTMHNRGNKFGKGHQTFLGKHHTKKTKQKISKANLGKIVSEETRIKLREIAKKIKVVRNEKGQFVSQGRKVYKGF